MVSLVALAAAWQPWSIESIRAALDELFPGEFLPPRTVGNFVVEGPVPDVTYLVQCGVTGHAGMFLIHNVPGPYDALSDLRVHIEDPDLRRMSSQHTSWLSVDLVHRHASAEDAFRFVALVMAKLAPADSVLLVHPSHALTAPFTDRVRATLASGGSPFGNA
jgi:hypothetical protein